MVQKKERSEIDPHLEKIKSETAYNFQTSKGAGG